MSTAAIVIAKGHSRRLPHKNVLPFAGRPLFAWSLLQAQCSHLVDRVYVSTDDEQIAGIAAAMNARVIMRPVLHPDACANPVILHALDIAEQDGQIDEWVHLLPTSPLRQPYDIDMMIRVYRDFGNPDGTVFPVAPNLETLIFDIHKPEPKVAIGNKSSQYGVYAGGMGVHTPATLRGVFKDVPPWDSEIDVDRASTDIGALLPGRVYRLEWWQQWEIDLPEHTELCEYYMKTKILTSPDVYERYRAVDIITKYDRRNECQKTSAVGQTPKKKT